VAAFPSAARALVPPAWAALREHPEGPVTLRLAEHEPDEAVAALVRRDVDVAVVHSYSLLPRDVPTSCDQRRLLDDPVLLALPPALAAARGLVPNEGVALAEFAGEPWLVPRPEESCHEMIQRACGAAGFVPDRTPSPRPPTSPCSPRWSRQPPASRWCPGWRCRPARSRSACTRRATR